MYLSVTLSKQEVHIVIRIVFMVSLVIAEAGIKFTLSEKFIDDLETMLQLISDG